MDNQETNYKKYIFGTKPVKSIRRTIYGLTSLFCLGALIVSVAGIKHPWYVSKLLILELSAYASFGLVASLLLVLYGKYTLSRIWGGISFVIMCFFTYGFFLDYAIRNIL